MNRGRARLPCLRSYDAWFMVAAIVLACSVAPSPLPAQLVGTLSGQVFDDESLQPISSARVAVVGSGWSALTDLEGRFQFDALPEGITEVRVSRLGYAPVSRVVRIVSGEVLTEEFGLSASAIPLDGLVVTATGLQRRRELGNAAVTLQVPDELDGMPATNLTSLLQGRATGVQVHAGSGSVGTAAGITIRGNGSIGLGNVPLVYVDGARVSNDLLSGPHVNGQRTSRLNDLNLDDIESIEIVKGPSAATLYGTEAAAGVIRITTKTGDTGDAEWTFRSELGASWDATRWPESVWSPRAFFPEDAVPDTLYRMNLLEGSGTGQRPWRTGLEQTYGATLRGGLEGVTYFLSSEYSHREGNLPTNEMSRVSVRGNLQVRPSSRVDVAISSGMTAGDIALPVNDNTLEGYIGAGLGSFPIYLPIVRDDPVTGEQAVRTCPLNYEISRALGVPIAFLDPCADHAFSTGPTFDDISTLENRQRIGRFIGSTTVQFRPSEPLSLSGTVGYDHFSDQSGEYIPVDPGLPFGDFSRGYRTIRNAVQQNLTIEGNATATFDLTPELRSTTAVGGQFFREHISVAESVGRQFPSGAKTVSNAVRTEGGESVSETRTVGLFVQQQFGYRDRLFLTPAVRFDRNSAFGENLGTKPYPRVTTSYVISEEEWFPFRMAESLRLRGGWGRSGRQPSSFDALQLLEVLRVTRQGQDVLGVAFSQPGNPDLKPETGTELEVGFEADLFGGKVGVDATWFRQVTSDVIVSRFVAPSEGFEVPMVTNLGEVRNRGVELGVSALAVNTPDYRWMWRINLSTLRNRITRLEDPIDFGVDGVAQRHQEGYPFGSYFSRDYYIDAGGMVESTEESVFMGHATPEFEGSISTHLTLYGRLTLRADLGFAGGHQQFNSSQEFRCGFLGGGMYGAICPEVFETGPDGERTDTARIKAAAAADRQYAPWMQDADFVRLRLVSARLELPASWVGQVRGRRGSFTISGENLGIRTRYDGLDPEINGFGGAGDVRSEFFTLPAPRRVTGRLSITF